MQVAVNFDKVPMALAGAARAAAVNLSKHHLDEHRARVMLVLDMSGSMRALYANGRVQALAERVLALVSRVDDDGSIEVIAFGSDASYLGELTLESHVDGLARLTKGRKLGRTNYAAAMHLVRDRVGAGPFCTQPPTMPTYVMFVTDGAPDSRRAATMQLATAATEPIFWQFMGVTASPGDANPNRFDYLRRLDTSVPGRLIDNAGFFAVDDLGQLEDHELYSRMLTEYPAWLHAAHTHAVLSNATT